MQTISGKLNLVDLAGSEDSRKLAGANSNMRGPDAASFVSGSLGILKEVIRAINQGNVGAGYADSRLTRIVKDSLVRFCVLNVCMYACFMCVRATWVMIYAKSRHICTQTYMYICASE